MAWTAGCRLLYCLRPSLSCLLLALLLAVISTVTGAARIQLTGEVGGNVTFNCRVDKHRNVEFLYFQKGPVFINGYHKSKNITEPTWQNTRMDDNKTVVHMYQLNLTHSGDYQCHVRYTDNRKLDETIISLKVTARYSKPSVAKSCSGENRGQTCLVTCASHGGYPGTKMLWRVTGTGNTSSQMWDIVNSSEVPSPSTMMFNSSSTAYFNCTNGELTFSCHVGDVTSAEYSLCALQVSPDNSSSSVIAAAVCAVVVITMVIVPLCCQYKKRLRGAALVDSVRGNINNDEVLALNENKEEKVAS